MLLFSEKTFLKFLADILNQLDVIDENVEFVLVGAFEEVIKLIDISSGAYLPYYMPALTSLKSILPKSENLQISSLVDKLLDRCSMVLGPNLKPNVAISCLNAITTYVGLCSEKQKLIIVAKLFPILMRRLDDSGPG